MLAVPASKISQRRLVRNARSPITAPRPSAAWPLTCPPVNKVSGLAACPARPWTWTWYRGDSGILRRR